MYKYSPYFFDVVRYQIMPESDDFALSTINTSLSCLSTGLGISRNTAKLWLKGKSKNNNDNSHSWINGTKLPEFIIRNKLSRRGTKKEIFEKEVKNTLNIYSNLCVSNGGPGNKIFTILIKNTNEAYIYNEIQKALAHFRANRHPLIEIEYQPLEDGKAILEIFKKEKFKSKAMLYEIPYSIINIAKEHKLEKHIKIVITKRPEYQKIQVKDIDNILKKGIANAWVDHNKVAIDRLNVNLKSVSEYTKISDKEIKKWIDKKLVNTIKGTKNTFDFEAIKKIRAINAFEKCIDPIEDAAKEADEAIKEFNRMRNTAGSGKTYTISIVILNSSVKYRRKIYEDLSEILVEPWKRGEIEIIENAEDQTNFRKRIAIEIRLTFNLNSAPILLYHKIYPQLREKIENGMIDMYLTKVIWEEEFWRFDN